MFYTPMIKRAMLLAYKAHDGQLDRGGYPYFAHVLQVAEWFEDEATISVALLHDAIEDGGLSRADLVKANMPDIVIEAVEAMTHKDGTTYQEYINSVKQNQIARIVKMKDLGHNCNLSRLSKVTDKDKERVKKYEAAWFALRLG